jgi:hypothetical protein
MRATHPLLATTLAAFALASLSSPAHAQRSSPGVTAARPAPIGAPLRGHLVRANRAHRHRAGSAYGPNFYPDYGPYDYTDDPDVRENAPTRIIMQTAAPAAPPAPAKIPEPLVMELRGDHWVRLASTSAEPNGAYFDLAAARTTPPPAPLPTAVLVFRDGHQEEAARYTIIGRTISIKSDYWTTGSWTRTIPLAQLDLPATLKLNQSRGANFALPSRPGEVMMRP